MNSRLSVSLRLMLGISLAVTAVMALGFYWELQIFHEQVQEEVRSKASVVASQLIATRSVLAASQDLINTDSQGRTEFKHLNPAAVGRLVADAFNHRTDIVLKQTRLDPRVSTNRPDATEADMLRRLAADPSQESLWLEERAGGQPLFRYLVPLKAEAACLNCHGDPKGQLDIAGYPKEGLALGQLAGAISVTVPMAPYYRELWHKAELSLGLTLLMLGFCLAVIYLVMSAEVSRPLEKLAMAADQVRQGNWVKAAQGFRGASQGTGQEIHALALGLEAMARQLQASYAALETRVEERTRQLRQTNEELARARQFEADFLAAVSHDLRTPLTSIIAQAEVLLDQDMGRLAPGQEEFLRDILGSGQDLLSLINDLLDLAKIEAGKTELHLAECDPVDLLREAIATVRPLAEKAGLTLTAATVPGDLPLARWDPPKVRRILLNLLSNALKFTPAGGRVAVRAWSDERGGSRWLWFAVEDSGIGIAPEEQEAVFEKYRQVGQAARGHHGGTGLGLPLARQLAELHGGFITLDSRVGSGSVFTVALPARPASPVLAAEQEEEEGRFRP